MPKKNQNPFGDMPDGMIDPSKLTSSEIDFLVYCLPYAKADQQNPIVIQSFENAIQWCLAARRDKAEREEYMKNVPKPGTVSDKQHAQFVGNIINAPSPPVTVTPFEAKYANQIRRINRENAARVQHGKDNEAAEARGFAMLNEIADAKVGKTFIVADLAKRYDLSIRKVNYLLARSGQDGILQRQGQMVIATQVHTGTTVSNAVKKVKSEKLGFPVRTPADIEKKVKRAARSKKVHVSLDKTWEDMTTSEREQVAYEDEVGEQRFNQGIRRALRSVTKK